MDNSKEEYNNPNKAKRYYRKIHNGDTIYNKYYSSNSNNISTNNINTNYMSNNDISNNDNINNKTMDNNINNYYKTNATSYYNTNGRTEHYRNPYIQYNGNNTRNYNSTLIDGTLFYKLYENNNDPIAYENFGQPASSNSYSNSYDSDGSDNRFNKFSDNPSSKFGDKPSYRSQSSSNYSGPSGYSTAGTKTNSKFSAPVIKVLSIIILILLMFNIFNYTLDFFRLINYNPVSNSEIYKWVVNASLQNDGTLHMEEYIYYNFLDTGNGLTRTILYNQGNNSSGTSNSRFSNPSTYPGAFHTSNYSNYEYTYSPDSPKYEASNVNNLEVYVQKNSSDYVQYKKENVANIEYNSIGKDGVYTETINNNSYFIKVYSPAPQKGFKQTLKLVYDLKNAGIQYNDAGELYYDFLGRPDLTKISDFTLNLKLPDSADVSDTKVYPHTYAVDSLSNIDIHKSEANKTISFSVDKENINDAIDARIVFPINGYGITNSKESNTNNNYISGNNSNSNGSYNYNGNNKELNFKKRYNSNIDYTAIKQIEEGQSSGFKAGKKAYLEKLKNQKSALTKSKNYKLNIIILISIYVSIFILIFSIVIRKKLTKIEYENIKQEEGHIKGVSNIESWDNTLNNNYNNFSNNFKKVNEKSNDSAGILDKFVNTIYKFNHSAVGKFLLGKFLVPIFIFAQFAILAFIPLTTSYGINLEFVQYSYAIILIILTIKLFLAGL